MGPICTFVCGENPECSPSVIHSTEHSALKLTFDIPVHASFMRPSVPIRAGVTNCDVISARNLSKAADWLIKSLACDMVNNILMYESQKHDTRHLLTGQKSGSHQTLCLP